jgi:transcriptional regulator with XRE-family HTH domain
LVAHPQNLIGPQLRRLRMEAGLSQEAFAAKRQRIGWDASRDIVKHIEAGGRRVADVELAVIAAVLKAPFDSLLPASRDALKIAVAALE